MSPSIWTRCGGSSNLRPLALDAWRVVEAQHIVATRKLVDSDEEQRILEDLIERHKPPRLRGPEFEGLHYLLHTPFRYPPLRRGSRFGTLAERGIWYGAEALRTAFSEVAYYRLLFLEGTSTDLPRLLGDLSAFQAAVRTARGIDLGAKPFAAHRSLISSRTSYATSQAIGREMRGAGVEAFRWISARDREGGACVGIFSPRAFARRRPMPPQTWFCVTTREAVEVSRKDFFSRDSFRFPRADFEVGGKLPSPGL